MSHSRPRLSRIYAPRTLALLVLAVMTPWSAAWAQALKDHDTYQSIDIDSDRFELNERDGQAILRGNVRVVQGGLTLLCETLVVHYDKEDDDENPSIARMDATGQVRLTSDSEKVESKWGIYDVAGRVVTLGGEVILTRGENQLNGERLELDLVSGLAKLDGDTQSGGRVRGRFSAPPAAPKDDGPDGR